MTGYQSRSERQSEMIERFLESDAEVLPLRLYKREVEANQKRNPNIVIEIDSVYKGSLYNCLIYKR